MKINDILMNYTSGEMTLEDANKALKDAEASFYLDPKKNELTEDEIKNGSAGLLDTGTGSLDKVKIDPAKMELLNCDMGEGYAMCIYKGKLYEVKGKKLVDIH